MVQMGKESRKRGAMEKPRGELLIVNWMPLHIGLVTSEEPESSRSSWGKFWRLFDQTIKTSKGKMIKI